MKIALGIFFLSLFVISVVLMLYIDLLIELEYDS